ATNAPIKFIGIGEKIDQFELFEPTRFAGTLLGIPDLEGLVQKVQDAMAEPDPEMVKRMMRGKFTLEDLYIQLKAIKKMGRLGKLLGMMGIGNIPDEAKEMAEQNLDQWEVVLNSMTKEEKETPKIIKKSRKRRIAKRIMSFLIEKGERVFLEKRICNRLGRGELGMELNQMTENKIKFVISVGGDGSILRVFHELPKKETPPVYGCAKIGTSIAFLSEGNEKTVYNDLEKILNGKYLIEKCSRLSTFLSTSPNSNIQLDEAINEA
ncbi:unnamed protein product, partial [marine sediment metagenome]